MCCPICPFASALIGSIAGSASGASVGAVSGWLLYAAYLRSGGSDSQGVAVLVFGTLGMAIGGSGGAVGGLIDGWRFAEGKGPDEGSAEGWGAGLGILWGLQPILWLSFTTDPRTAITSSLVVILAVVSLGASAGRLGGIVARPVVRSFSIRKIRGRPTRPRSDAP